MRIGLMRENIEIWNAVTTVNEFGMEVKTKELFLICPAAVKHISNDNAGDITKTFNQNIQFTIRYNRYFKAPNNSMYIIWDGREYDIIMHNNYHSLNKYIALTAVHRSK